MYTRDNVFDNFVYKICNSYHRVAYDGQSYFGFGEWKESL